jgi:UMF1 family MFS transporter
MSESESTEISANNSGKSGSDSGSNDDAESNRRISGYCFYDWGKSSFETSVVTAILPAWFAYLFLEANGLTANIFGREMTSDAVWSYSVTIAALFVALLSPSFGIIADRRTIKMYWLRILTYVGAGSTLLLAFAPILPISTQWVWLVVWFVLANVGLNGAGVFYNALLPHMGKEEEMDSISNKAFAYGYFGGGILLLFHLILVMGVDGAWVIPFAMASSGVWWFGFALITFARVPEPPIENEMEKLGLIDSAKLSITELKKTVSEAKNFKTLFIYMLAYFFFIDGINSVTSLAGIYGITVLGISITGLILTILIIQFVAAPAAIGFTILASKWGTKRVLTASLFGWCIVIVGALSFAPLELIDHAEYDIMYDWDETNSTYVVAVSSGISDISQDDGEQAWIQTHADVLPVIQNNKVTEKTSMQWSVDDAGPVNVSLAVGSESSITSFMNSVNSSRYSVSVNGGGLANATAVGLDHPTNLGEGAIDFIPVLIRKVIWAPLGISVFFQWLLLGVMAGLLLGGSQGLARSLFGQMVPETRSAEFFGFFGFFGKVAALFGPLLYATLTVMFDSRVGILSIGALIIIGAVLMRWVDVEDGIAVARAEDAANRS